MQDEPYLWVIILKDEPVCFSLHASPQPVSDWLTSGGEVLNSHNGDEGRPHTKHTHNCIRYLLSLTLNAHKSRDAGIRG